MPKYTVMILTRAQSGRRAEFEEWYENTHLDDVMATMGGVRTAQRFDLVHQVGLKTPNDHLAVYEVEGDSPEALIAELNATRSDRDMSDSLDGSEASIWVFQTAGEKHINDHTEG